MKNQQLIISAFVLLVIVSFATILLLAIKKPTTQQQANPTPTPIGPKSPIYNAHPTSQNTPIPTGNITTTDGITTNNFYKTSTVFDAQGDRALADTDSYRITFSPTTGQFLVTIIGHGFAQNRATAEQALLTLLGITQETACQLNVVVQTTSAANPNEAGQGYPLSFCPPSTAKTVQTQPTIYQTKETLTIAVGNAPTSGDGSVVGVAKVITSNLSQSGGALFDQFKGHPRGVPATMTLPPATQQLFPSYRVVLRGGSNIGPAWRYWCTDLIIDTYNLALKRRILGENLGAVQSQVTFWKTEGKGFLYVRYVANHQGALTKLFSFPQLGGPIFWESQEGTYNGGEHVGLIKGGNIDSHGNGEIDTYEANAGHTSGKYPIVNWQIKNVPYPVVGFGLYTGK